MSWIKVLEANELPEGDRQVIKVGGREVMVIHHQGELFAIDNRCPHLRFPITLGRIDHECAIHCPWHRSAFDLKTGDVKAWAPWPPGVITRVLGTISREKTLPVFPVRIEDGGIWVQITK